MAIHEAGHQVVAVAVRVRSRGVSLSGDYGQSRDGLNRHLYEPEEARYWELLKKEIQILLAGEWAVRIFYDRAKEDSDAYGSENDWKVLGPLLRELSEDSDVPVFALQERHESAVLNCLTDRWCFVERLAGELLETENLSGEQVTALLQDMPSFSG
ncbi:hypothetical protein JI739_18715 [Ramlibacter sp. AW1]|uniref:Uncharacterized protein n=1 Tax=Ramlibacter aurantiacus TaxID=2801330 RepID=A0A936ZRZ4_9BURK|nr:hypothetical protein [Ramlibacter aurantiacus]MBL0422388.1 hypothetical protein [Ramlibacter aurantiacus]